jgi:PAS domain S-box-containing protein
MSTQPHSTLTDPQQIIADLKQRLAEAERRLEQRTGERDEALEQQIAAAEVLAVINSSLGDLAPVFDAILDKALRLCDAAFGVLWTYDGAAVRAVALRNVPEPYRVHMADQAFRLDGASFMGRAVLGQVVHIADNAAEEPYRNRVPIAVAAVELAGTRTFVHVPLIKDGVVLGIFTVFRQVVHPFTDKQITLLQNFAAQAVIAMENARVLGELRERTRDLEESLEYQTATSDVLNVISRSTADVQPVLDTVVETAGRLCGADIAMISIREGEVYRYVSAASGADPEYWAILCQRRIVPGRDSMAGRVALEGRVVHIEDIWADPDYAVPEAVATGIRTNLGVPLLREGAVIGTIGLARNRVQPYTERQIELVRTFADQAVIALENARLITETREALEQQTATAEVLGVINSSPGDLAPVWDAMLEKATRLCEAAFGFLWTWDTEQVHRLVFRGVPAELMEALRQPLKPPSGSILERIVGGQDVASDLDVLEGPRRSPTLASMGARSCVGVALRKDDKLLGGITIFRREVRPFSAKEIALLQNFAAQAVIAMENARLITETREALDQQTATAEVLGVINSSPGDLAPVFETMLEKAMSLCGAAFGEMRTYDGERFRRAATQGVPSGYAEYYASHETGIYGPGTGPERILAGERVVHVPDLVATEPYQRGDPDRRALVDLGGARTALIVALRKDAAVLGFIMIYRQEIRPFSDRQIALLQNFAEQAVIAMENARLITETREALEQQTATAEVLGIINSSPGDLAPLWDAMLEKALHLCEADLGGLYRFDGKAVHPVTVRSGSKAASEILRQSFVIEPGSSVARLVHREAEAVQVRDIVDTEAYRSGAAYRVKFVELTGARTALWVALRQEKTLVGVFVIYRQEVRPFTDKQIALLQNFAAQAVIAMENARLITETREALEQQTATAEVLQVINSSPGDLQPVFEVILGLAIRLCDANFGHFRTYDGEGFPLAAVQGELDLVELHQQRFHRFVPGPHNPISRLLSGERLIHIADAAADEAYHNDPGWPQLVASGARSVLAVALRKDDALLGYINVYRNVVGQFTDKQIALLQNFAAQAVIAMENARLLDEIRQRQAELRVTFDNMADGVAMFDQTLHLAAWNRNFQELLNLPDELLAGRPGFDEYIRYLTERGEFGERDPAAEIARLRSRLKDHYSFERTRPDGTVIEVRNNPMPDGGMVVIYSDITERKRSEAEIRAARDAAEAAYRDLQAAQASLVQAQKMAALGQLTAGIAHEIKNPLNFVNNFASLSTELLDELKEVAEPVMDALDDKRRAELDETMVMLSGNLDKIVEHGQRADNIVKSMLEHSRGVSGERREVDLNGVIEEALNLAYHGARAQDQGFNITLERDYEPTLKPIELAPQEMTRVFLNLFGNGFYATNKRARDNGDGSFRPVLAVRTRDAGDAVEVRVRDNGTGIPPDIKDKLFQPFFTTKPTGEGTGLGLSISYDIVTQQHGGTITVESEEGLYTEFTLHLPRR